MILDENGEKWACENCVKGHRVSSCQHKERPLQHINKKGRPVSQCPHCRGLRKNRASHVKCECGSHPHSKEGSVDKSSPSSAGSCNCMSGMKCTCSVKKEAPDFDGLQRLPKPVSSHRRTRSKPEVHNRKSESAVPKFLHSFHPSLSKQNNAAQEFGQPYPNPRHYPTATHPYRHAQRSVDSLPLMHFATPSSPYEAQYLNLPLGAGSSASIPSEHGSPYLSAQTTPLEYGHPMPDFDVSSPGQLLFRNHALSQGNPARYSVHDLSFFSNDYENPQARTLTETPLSADRDAFTWSEYDINGAYGGTHNIAMPKAVAPSEASVDFSVSSQPPLSRSSTGTISEAGDQHFRQGSVSSAGYNSGPHPTITIDSSRVTPAFGDSPQDAFSITSASSYAETPSDFVFPAHDSSAYAMGSFGAVDQSIHGKDFATGYEHPDVMEYSPGHQLDAGSVRHFTHGAYWGVPAVHEPNGHGFHDSSDVAANDRFHTQMHQFSWPQGGQ